MSDVLRLIHPDSDLVVEAESGPRADRYLSQGWRVEEAAEPEPVSDPDQGDE